MHQSTEVAGTGENLSQGSWYAMMNEGGIADLLYQGDIATSFWTMSISSAPSASWLDEPYFSGMWMHQRIPVEEL